MTSTHALAHTIHELGVPCTELTTQLQRVFRCDHHSAVMLAGALHSTGHGLIEQIGCQRDTLAQDQPTCCEPTRLFPATPDDGYRDVDFLDAWLDHAAWITQCPPDPGNTNPNLPIDVFTVRVWFTNAANLMRTLGAEFTNTHVTILMGMWFPAETVKAVIEEALTTNRWVGDPFAPVH